MARIGFSAKKVLKDFGFHLPSTLSEVLLRAPKMSNSEPDLPPLSSKIDKDDKVNQYRHVRFGFDTSSDSSDESAYEKPLLRGPVMETVERINLLLMNPL